MERNEKSSALNGQIYCNAYAVANRFRLYWKITANLGPAASSNSPKTPHDHLPQQTGEIFKPNSLTHHAAPPFSSADPDATMPNPVAKPSAPDNADLLNITGNFVRDTSFGSHFRFDFQGSNHTGTFTLVQWTGTNGFNIGDFSDTDLGGSLTGDFSFSGNSLAFTAIPEPSTVLLLLGALAFLALLRRKARPSPR
ncbi:MAG: PEP-CTERM sorting domain-containing protein [Verrucomicrobiia bacterium]